MSDIDWKVSDHPVPYLDAVRDMDEIVAHLHEGKVPETVWMLEHPPLYTAGTTASDDELVETGGLPVYRTRRGGRYTYHGPGQQIAYVMLDLAHRGHDVRAYVSDLQVWIIRTLERFGVCGECRKDRVGVWVVDPVGKENKIAAVGVRVRRWVTFHGISINRAPDLMHYTGIVPCGIRGHGVTSLEALGIDVGADELRTVMEETFQEIFQVVGR